MLDYDKEIVVPKINMDIEKWKIYEDEKRRLKALGLSAHEYEQKIKALVEKLKL